MSNALKPWLVLASIFIAGVLSGAALTIALTPQFPHMPPPMALMEKRIMSRITRELTLTTDQQAKVQPIIADASKQIQGVHTEEIQRVTEIIKKADEQVKPILTDDQKAQLAKLEAAGDNLFFGRMKGWGPGDHEHFRGGPGGWPGGSGAWSGGHGDFQGGPPPGPPPDEMAPNQAPQPPSPPPANTNAPAK